MVQPRPLGEVYNPNKGTQKEYFASKYSLKAKAGGSEGLIVGQDIYCLPLVSNGFYSFDVHSVRPKGQKNGFKKNQYGTYILCKGVDPYTGEENRNATCCQLAQEQYNNWLAGGKKGQSLISFHTKRYCIPVLLLGNNTGSKTATKVPLTKLTMSGRDYSYLELSEKAFKELMNAFKNDLVNNGRISYELEGPELLAAQQQQMAKHILKISINKSEGFGNHSKSFSFISFDNQAIGAETGSYMNITQGVANSAKLQAEVADYIETFQNEIETIFTPWEDQELISYVQAPIQAISSVASTGVIAPSTVPVRPEIPKEQQVVTLQPQYVQQPQQQWAPQPQQQWAPQPQPQWTPQPQPVGLGGVAVAQAPTIVQQAPSVATVGDFEDDLFDSQDMSTLDDLPPVSTPVAVTESDMSFNMDDEDFFGAQN